MVSISFFIIQGIGAVAWLFLLSSYYCKNTNKILLMQICSTIFFLIHYYLLDAYSGVLICLFEVFRDYLYYKTDKDRLIFWLLIPIQFIIGIFNFHYMSDLFPILSSLIDGYTLTFKKEIVLIGAIISYLLWIIYDLSVGSYVGLIADGILILSNIGILLYKKELR